MSETTTGELGSVTNPIPMHLIWYKADEEGNKTFYTAAGSSNTLIGDATTEVAGKVRLATVEEASSNGGNSVVTATQLKDKIQPVESSDDATQVGVLYLVTGS